MEFSDTQVRILVIGTSPLGERIARFCEDLGARVRNPGKYMLDVVDSGRLDEDIARFRPHLVFNCAEKSNLDDCERRPDWAIAVNSLGAAKVALACRVNDVELVHISTDMVFSGFGGGGPYTELDETYPVNAYGLSKLLGENAVKVFMPPGRFVIIRVGWLYGAEIDKGPAWDASQTFIRGELTRRAWVPDSWRGSPTHVGEAAFQIVKNVRVNETEWQPVVHVGPDEYPVSWFDFLVDDFPMIETVDPRKLLGRSVTHPRNGGLKPTNRWATAGYADSIERFREELKEPGGDFREYQKAGQGA